MLLYEILFEEKSERFDCHESKCNGDLIEENSHDTSLSDKSCHKV